MIEWAIVAFKTVHIAGLCIWCGGVLALPMLLSWHDPANAPAHYRKIRQITHLTYTWCVTPAAVVAIVAGTWLIFLREMFVPWLYAKLLFVALLAMAHIWIGHITVQIGDTRGRFQPPPTILPLAAALLPMIAILVLVLAKPDAGALTFPQWLTTPRGNQLPFDVPSR